MYARSRLQRHIHFPETQLDLDRDGPAASMLAQQDVSSILQPASTEHDVEAQSPAIRGHQLAEINVVSPDAASTDGPVTLQPSLSPTGAAPDLPLQRQVGVPGQAARGEPVV